MAMNTISGYSTTRVTGLNSGLDTDALIEKAMAASQSKLDRMNQNKTKLEWKRDAYTDINKKIAEFSDKYMSQLSPDNIFSSSVYKAFKISISDKYSAYFDITGTPSASISRHQITKTTLAEYATIKGEQYRNRVAGLSGTSNANSLAAVTGTKKLAADTSTSTTKLSDLKYEDGTSVFQFSSSSDRVSISVNGETFTFNQDDTLSTMMSDINGRPAAKAKMSFTADGQISFESTVKGAKTALVFGNVAGPAVFGKDGAFGIKDLVTEPKSLINDEMTLREIADATGKTLGAAGSGDFVEFAINGKQFHFGEDTKLKDVLDAVNSDPDAQVTMTYDQERDRFMLRSDLQGSGTKIKTENLQGTQFFGEEGITGIAEDETEGYQTIERTKDTIATAAAKMGVDIQFDQDGKFSFKVNDVEFSFSSTDSLEKMINTINGNEDAKARLTYSQITDSFIFTSSETGRNSSVKVENVNGVNAFGDATSFFGAAESEAKGTDAVIVIDGETITQASNTFTLDGMQFTLKTDFDADNTPDNIGPANFSVDQDIDKVVEKVKAFVVDYNKLTQSLYAMVTEAIDYDYPPLTDAQREDMSDKEIEKWETEAKKGILRNDNTVKDLLSSLRMDMFEVVEGTGLSAYNIGFNTSKYAAGEYGGQITFDEDKFRAAMKKDPDAVSRVMANVSTATDAKTEKAESGMITRFFDQMSAFRTEIRNVKLKNTNKSIDDASNSITNMIKKMYEEQERLYSQFSRMETLLSQYQSQSSWLTQQIAGL